MGRKAEAARSMHELGEDEITDYVAKRFGEVKKSGRIKNLVAFQAMNKYMIMAKDQNELKALGNIVAGYKRGMIRETIKEYEIHLDRALAKSPTVKTHCNVMLHIFGYFSRHFSQNEKEEFFRMLKEFKEGRMSIGRTLAGISPIIYRFNNTYLASQTYFLLYSEPKQENIFSLLS